MPSREYPDGTVDDCFELPQGMMTIRLRYSGGTYPFKVHYIVVRPVVAVTWIEDVKQPVIRSASVSDGMLTLNGSTYGTLYGIPMSSVQASVSTSPYITEDDYTVSVPAGDVQDGSISFPIAEELSGAPALYLRIRHVDVEGSISRWSDIFIHTQEPTE